eukprot:TRINITY_DN608_c0_g2_i2.p1 TRINITY_DN608_c0_g2~~TRINITY_DN608_c0_g2_i2.p1  ORF type:complete len:582 (-),score=156.77 TRINITY_DN608_c0_g2_i2:2-1558(-)
MDQEAKSGQVLSVETVKQQLAKCLEPVQEPHGRLTTMFANFHIRLNTLHGELVDKLTIMTAKNLRRLSSEVDRTSKDIMVIEGIKVEIDELYSLVRNDLVVSITEINALIKTDRKRLRNVKKIMKTLDSEFTELDGVMKMNRMDWRTHKQHQKDLKRTELARQRKLIEKLQQEIDKNKLLIHTGSDKELDGYQPIHLIFAFDKSGSVSSDNFKDMKTFAKCLVEITEKFSGQYYYSFVQYGELAHVTLDCGDAKELKKTIADATKIRGIDPLTGAGLTNSAAALKAIKDEVLVSGKMKSPYMKQIVIFITDGVSNCPNKTAATEEAEKLHKMFPHPSVLVWLSEWEKREQGRVDRNLFKNRGYVDNKMTDDFAGLSKLVPDIEAHLKTMDVQNKWEKESTTTIKKSVKICGINLFQTEKIIHTPQGRQFLAAKNKQLERQIQELVEQETQMNQDYQKFCDAINEELGTAKTGIRDHEINQDAMKLKKPLLDEAVDLKTKKKKYRLRGRSSETAKAHRG